MRVIVDHKLVNLEAECCSRSVSRRCNLRARTVPSSQSSSPQSPSRRRRSARRPARRHRNGSANRWKRRSLKGRQVRRPHRRVVADPKCRRHTAARRFASTIAIGGELTFSSTMTCDNCGREYPVPEPRLYSFNSPLGACPECEGFGNIDRHRHGPGRARPDQDASRRGDRALEHAGLRPRAARN